MILEKELEKISQSFMANPDAALKKLNSLEQVAVKNKDAAILNDIRFKIAQIENTQGRHKAALDKLIKIYNSAELQKDLKGQVKISNELGNSYLADGNLNSALDSYKKSIELCEVVCEPKRAAVPLINVGQIYWELGEFAKAEEYYSRALKLSEELSPAVSGDALINLGILASQEQDFKKAESFFLKAEEQYVLSSERSRMPLIHVNLALLYQDMGNIPKAEKYHKQSMNGFIKTDNILGQMHAGLNYAGFLLNIDKLDNVKEILDRCKLLNEELKADDYNLQIYDYYRHYYQKKGDFEQALEYFERLHDTEIAFIEKQQKDKVAEALAKFDDEQKEREARLLKEKNKKIEKQKQELDIANSKLKKANLELENRIDRLLAEWHSQELITRDKEKLDGFETMVSGVAHQWKQPLNFIAVSVQNLVDAWDFDEFDEQTLKNFASQIDEQIKYMSDIINDFAYSFRMMKEEQIFKISHSLELIEKLFSKTLTLEGINYQLDLQGDPDVSGRESEIIQVFVILFSNAIEAFERNKLKEKKISIIITESNDKLIARFINNGPPVPEEVMNRMFDVYFSTKKENVNTGLGLALAKKMLNEHFQGDISCSNVENGIEFKIEIPLSV